MAGYADRTDAQRNNDNEQQTIRHEAGDEHHRCGGTQLPAQPIQLTDSRGVGQLPVENQQVEVLLLQGCAKTGTVRKRLQLVAGFPGPQADQFDLAGIVFK